MRFTIILDEPPTAANASFSHKAAYYNCIGSIVDLLEQSSKQNRKKAYQKLLPDHTPL